jgi:hypothetical protein
MEPNQQEKTNGALIGSVIVIIILVLGGIYFLKRGVPAPAEPVPSESSEDIEAELDNMDLESLDQGI